MKFRTSLEFIILPLCKVTGITYMLEVAPDRFALHGMEKKPDERYKEYAIRWKAVARGVNDIH